MVQGAMEGGSAPSPSTAPHKEPIGTFGSAAVYSWGGGAHTCQFASVTSSRRTATTASRLRLRLWAGDSLGISRQCAFHHEAACQN